MTQLKIRSRFIHSKHLLFSLTVVCLIILSTAFTDSILINASSDSEWWDLDWDFRREFEINDVTENVLNSQFLIEIPINYFKSRANTLGQDIRFVDSSNSQINYWIESWNESNVCKFWLKIPQLSSTTTNRFYIYYGNSDVSSNSNGDSVFEFFDDFSGNLDKWIVVNALNSDGICSISPGSNYIMSKYNFSGSTVTECRKRMGGNMRHNYGFASSWPRPSIGNYSVIENSADGASDIKDGHTDSIENLPFLSNTWTISSLVWLDGYAQLYQNRGEMIDMISPYLENRDLSLGVQTWGSATASLEVDWIFVRNYYNFDINVEVGLQELSSYVSTNESSFKTLPFVISILSVAVFSYLFKKKTKVEI